MTQTRLSHSPMHHLTLDLQVDFNVNTEVKYQQQAPCSQSCSKSGSRSDSSWKFFYIGLFIKPTI